eukprot:Skav228397  [mRNA]  locus=scaffold1911:116587:122554:+ [translate_table: standard]
MRLMGRCSALGTTHRAIQSPKEGLALTGDLVQEIKLPGQPFDDGAIFRSDSEVLDMKRRLQHMLASRRARGHRLELRLAWHRRCVERLRCAHSNGSHLPGGGEFVLLFLRCGAFGKETLRLQRLGMDRRLGSGDDDGIRISAPATLLERVGVQRLLVVSPCRR